MKKADLRSSLLNIVLTAMVSISGIMALATAYDFTLNGWQVVGVCLLSAAVTCIAGCIPRGLWALPVLGLLAVRQLWESSLADHTEAVLWYISTMLDKVYDIGYVIWWTGNDHLHQDTTAFFMMLGMLASILTGLGLSKHRTWPGIVMGALLLMPGMLITDLGPEPVWLLLLLSAILCLFLTRLTHRTDPSNAQKLTLRAMVCIAVLMSILTTCFHPDRYTAPSFPAVENLLEHLEQLLPTEGPLLNPTVPSGSVGNGSNGSYIPMKINLNHVGPKAFSYRTAFSLACSESGWLYLREASYGTYTGTSWIAYKDREEFSINENFLQAQQQSVHINSYSPAKEQFTPYYCNSLQLVNGILPNTDALSVYNYDYQPLRDDWAALWQASYGSEPVPQEWNTASVYLELPDSARENAQHILNTLAVNSSMNVLDIAQSIGSYVRSSAAYDLRTMRMPSGNEDFAIWFLENSETGYCVHFASAATVLLRAAGIPARYTVGYLVKTGAGLERLVYQGNAHAWVEYYLPEFGWMILEVTPGSTGALPTDPPTEPTTIPTDPSTEPPTQPEPPTTAPKPTQPSTQVPTQPTTPGGSAGQDKFTIPDWVWQSLSILLWVLAAVALVIAQWRLRLMWLMQRLHRGGHNRQALSRWRHTIWLARLRKEAPPQRLLALANKAKFSQHTLTHGELRQFDLYRAETINMLRKRNIFLRFVYRIILAIY